MTDETKPHVPKYSEGYNSQKFQLTFAGFLAVRLMEFDYRGVHYSYHGHKLRKAVRRLIATPPVKPTAAELFIRSEAAKEWGYK
jgi:hypothetical protein